MFSRFNVIIKLIFILKIFIWNKNMMDISIVSLQCIYIQRGMEVFVQLECRNKSINIIFITQYIQIYIMVYYNRRLHK